MTHVFALAHLRGRPGAGPLVDRGLAALTGPFRDAQHGGWYSSLDGDGGPAATDKSNYDHAFVVLAAAAATCAGRPGAAALLEEALACIDEHFWVPRDGLAVEEWDRAWTVVSPYRGANANMHLVEAFLAASDATGDATWRVRALGMAERFVHGQARAHAWRLPEHYDSDWRVLPDYNADRPADPFRPYGATVGHWFEWSRLLVHLHASLDEPPPWLLDDAVALFGAAVDEGWAVDGADGFVYTVDWDGTPVVRARMHWVLAEALSAASALHTATGHAQYAAWRAVWWRYAERHVVDLRRGSWRHELDEHNGPAASTWTGKPDVYHAYQAVLLGQLPLTGSLVASAALQHVAPRQPRRGSASLQPRAVTGALREV
jgi:mannose/cellobiose epimerase-like protein (N-acyl-D-glucosamine 2-epimerase family)